MDVSRELHATPNKKWEVQRLDFCIEVNLAEHAIALSGKMFEGPEVSAAIANAALFLSKHPSSNWQVNVISGFVANMSGLAAFRQIMSTFLVRCNYSDGFMLIERAHEHTAVDTKRIWTRANLSK